MIPRDAESSLEALRWLEQGEAFDRAILDMHMPEMDGVALARRVRERHAALPLVLFSSLGRREVGENETLFNAFLAKPIRRSEEHTSELQSHSDLVCRLLLEQTNKICMHPMS